LLATINHVGALMGCHSMFIRFRCASSAAQPHRVSEVFRRKLLPDRLGGCATRTPKSARTLTNTSAVRQRGASQKNFVVREFRGSNNPGMSRRYGRIRPAVSAVRGLRRKTRHPVRLLVAELRQRWMPFADCRTKVGLGFDVSAFVPKPIVRKARKNRKKVEVAIAI
jgi:hypothetical protein